MRGIDFIQIPTTILACVDSSVGGKVAVNSKYGKNTVGAFYQPKAVFCNVNFLSTLDLRQLKAGLGEILKYAYIEQSCLCHRMSEGEIEGASENYELFDFLIANPEKFYEKNLNTFGEIIKICLILKKTVVENDEKEIG